MITRENRTQLTVWLSLCCIFIFIMALIGAITRLTESGLSITRWEPIKGALPPLNDAAWDEAFNRYKATPQYSGINVGMNLDAFKGIYFWEWIHRVWGRLIGLVYAVPFLFFLLKKKIPAGFAAPLFGILLLGGLQGFIGWFMVQSGLEAGQVSVSPYRLALHLGLALIIYGCIAWQLFRLNPQWLKTHSAYNKRLHLHGLLSLLLLSLTIVWGAFTAGLDAGKIYNSFPLMDGYIVPPDFLSSMPWHINLTANPSAVQLTHRCLATLTILVMGLFAWRMRVANRPLSLCLGGAIMLQYILGIVTVLTGSHIVSATLHQANAILALSLMLACLFYIGNKTKA